MEWTVSRLPVPMWANPPSAAAAGSQNENPVLPLARQKVSILSPAESVRLLSLSSFFLFVEDELNLNQIITEIEDWRIFQK